METRKARPIDSSTLQHSSNGESNTSEASLTVTSSPSAQTVETTSPAIQSDDHLLGEIRKLQDYLVSMEARLFSRKLNVASDDPVPANETEAGLPSDSLSQAFSDEPIPSGAGSMSVDQFVQLLQAVTSQSSSGPHARSPAQWAESLPNAALRDKSGMLDLKLVMDQYKLYVDDAHEVSRRLTGLTEFFITLSTALAAGVWLFFYNVAQSGAKLVDVSDYLGMGPALGAVLGYAWLSVTFYYYRVLEAKKQVLRAMEDKLPMRPFLAERILRDSTGWDAPLRKALRFSAFFCLPVILLIAFSVVGIVFTSPDKSLETLWANLQKNQDNDKQGNAIERSTSEKQVESNLRQSTAGEETQQPPEPAQIFPREANEETAPERGGIK